MRYAYLNLGPKLSCANKRKRLRPSHWLLLVGLTFPAGFSGVSVAQTQFGTRGSADKNLAGLITPGHAQTKSGFIAATQPVGQMNSQLSIPQDQFGSTPEGQVLFQGRPYGWIDPSTPYAKEPATLPAAQPSVPLLAGQQQLQTGQEAPESKILVSKTLPAGSISMDEWAKGKDVEPPSLESQPLAPKGLDNRHQDHADQAQTTESDLAELEGGNSSRQEKRQRSTFEGGVKPGIQVALPRVKTLRMARAHTSRSFVLNKRTEPSSWVRGGYDKKLEAVGEEGGGNQVSSLETTQAKTDQSQLSLSKGPKGPVAAGDKIEKQAKPVLPSEKGATRTVQSTAISALSRTPKQKRETDASTGETFSIAKLRVPEASLRQDKNREGLASAVDAGADPLDGQPAPGQLVPGQLVPGRPVSLSILFSEGSVEMKPALNRVLQNLAGLMRVEPQMQIQLFAFATGESPRRLALSRALRVRKVLTDQGVASSRIVIRPLGNKAETGAPDRLDIKSVE